MKYLLLINHEEQKLAALSQSQLDALVAACVGLQSSDVLTKAHKPVSASVGNSFVIAEVTGEALTRATPDIGRFREAAKTYTAMGPNRLPLYLYAHVRIGARLALVSDRVVGPAACARLCHL